MIQTKNIDKDCDIKLNQKYAGLFKFGEYQHMFNFYQKGELYFNTFDFFKELEISEDGRGDKNEYSFYHYSGEGIKSVTLKMYPNGKEQEAIILQGGKDLIDLTLNNNDREYSHLYSLSAIDIEWSIKNNYIMNPKNFAPNKDYIVAIYKPNVFINRVFDEINKIKCNGKAGFMEYVDKNTYTGTMGPFKKFDNFSYQNEYRIALNLPTNEPYKLYIGSIKDIVYPPIPKKDFFSSSCEIKYVIDEGTITQQITNK